MIGILGGTFDPVHSGHLAVAVQCRELLGLDEVRLLPSSRPPHRPRPLASPADRLAMVRLAVVGVPGLAVDDREVRRGGTSYAVDTMKELVSGEPRNQFVLLLGHDAALEFGSWRRAAELGRLAGVAVFSRAGTPGIDRETLNRSGIPRAARLVEVDSPPISATEVRRRLAAGEDVTGMLPASVIEYIREHALYGSGA